jgi:hypothetical protein
MPDLVLSGYQPDADFVLVEESGTTVTLTEGSVLGRQGGSFAIESRGVSNTTFNIFGTIYGSGWAALDAFDEVGTRIHIGGNAALYDTGVGAMVIEASFDASLWNQGSIVGNRGFGVVIIDPEAAAVTNDGYISGGPGAVELSAWEAGSAATVVNRGTIESVNGPAGVSGQANGEAIWSSAAITSINNSGEVLARHDDASAIAISTENRYHTAAAVIVNSGLVRSDDRWGIDLSQAEGTISITNSGEIVGRAGSIAGSAAADTLLNSGSLSGRVALGGGNDSFDSYDGSVAGAVDGGAGNDTLSGGTSNDTLAGGAGDDMLRGNGGNDRYDGGAASDTVTFAREEQAVRVDLAAGRVTFIGRTWPAELVAAVENAVGGNSNDVLIGSAVANRLDGDWNDDALAAGGGSDTLLGGEGNDTLDGGDGTDRLDGGAGRDTVLYTANTSAVRIDLVAGRASFPGKTWAAEALVGIENATTGSGADTFVGNGVANVFRGGAGNDTLGGASGGDVLAGGAGRDILVGGSGRDTFEFGAAAESAGRAIDTLRAGGGGAAFDLPGSGDGDRIDLSGIDANTTAGNDQTFAFGVAKGIGRVWVEEVGQVTHVRANVDADAAVEFELAIEDGGVRASAYSALDFIL